MDVLRKNQRGPILQRGLTGAKIIKLPNRKTDEVEVSILSKKQILLRPLEDDIIAIKLTISDLKNLLLRLEEQ